MPHIKVKPFTVSPDLPFEEDYFERKKLVESICNLSLNIEEPLVIGLKAPWGHGKSTIIARLEAYINKEQYGDIGFIKYDAFKNDYVSDVFVSISSSIASYLEFCLENEGAENKREIINSAKDKFIKSGGKICKSLIKNAAIRGVKYVSAGILDLPEMYGDLEKAVEGSISDSASNIADESMNVIDSLIKERLSDSSKDQALLASFTKDLNFALKTTGKNRLIFVIDELDRCRPSFSVEVLEKIKHFFSCENVLFILLYNKEQLESSITHIYGVKNPNVYLQRFIDLESDVSINHADLNDEQTTRKFIKYVIDKHEFLGEWPEAIAYTLKSSFMLFGDETSLRAVERICTRVASYCLIQRDRDFIYDKHLIVSLCMLIICHPKYFDAIYERAKIVSSHRGESKELFFDINSTEKTLREYLYLIKNSKNNLFSRMYEYVIYYLYVTDGSNNGNPFQGNSGCVERENYLKYCCGHVSIFSME